MSNKTIKHEVKLQKSVIILLGFLAFGVCANIFAPTFSIKEAKADISWLQNITYALDSIDGSLEDIAGINFAIDSISGALVGMAACKM